MLRISNCKACGRARYIGCRPCGGAYLGEESTTSASKLDGKIECIIMQSAVAIITQRRSVSGKKVVKKLTRQAPSYRIADR